MNAFCTFSRLEGILPALESSHALAYAMEVARPWDANRMLLVNLSGRGDKDVDTVAQQLKKKSKNESVGGRNVTP